MFDELPCTLCAFSSVRGGGLRTNRKRPDFWPVADLTGGVIVGAQCKITNLATDVSATTTTNEDGIYVLPDLRPAAYRLTIQKEGFRTVIQPNLQLYVQEAVNQNFILAVGSASETVAVEGEAPLLQTDSAAASTFVNGQFVQNTPLNGRSFQSLIALAPAVVFVALDLGDGQFSVNGQRSNANYFMVDGGVRISVLPGAPPSMRPSTARLRHSPPQAAPTDWSPSMPCRNSASRPRRIIPPHVATLCRATPRKTYWYQDFFSIFPFSMFLA
jgi:hypothetical protein